MHKTIKDLSRITLSNSAVFFAAGLLFPLASTAQDHSSLEAKVLENFSTSAQESAVGEQPALPGERAAMAMRDAAELRGQVEDFDDAWGTSASKRAAILRLATLSEDLLTSSPSREEYSAARGAIDALDESLSYSFGEDGRSVGPGEKKKALVRARLAANVQDGIRPELSVLKMLRIQYRPASGELWLKTDWHF